MDRSRVAIIVPAFNEERSIAAIVGSVARHGVPIVVSDGSSDRTAQVAGAAGAIVVEHRENRGYDAALNSGFGRAAELGAELLVTFDADGQHDPDQIPKFARLLAGGHWMVIGVRPKTARMSERIFAAYTRLAYGIHDPLCGMKGYSINAYRELGHFAEYGSMGTELMLHCAKAGHPFAEVSISVAPRPDQPRVGSAWRANSRIVRALIMAVIRARRLRA